MNHQSRIKLYFLIGVALWTTMGIAQTPSPKRGMGLDQSKTSLADLTALSSGVSWYYCWGTSTYLNYESTGVAFVPMTWNGGYNRTDLINFLNTHPNTEYLLAFNEPNFRDQANMTPSQAAAAWPDLEQIADQYNLKIVSPAPNWCGWCVEEGGTTYYSPYQWLEDFFTACPDCRVDYIGVHFYMGSKDAVKGSIDSLYNQFHKPIWLTEFNMDKNGMGDNGTIDEQRAFMVDMIDWMEQDEHVYRYAWFLMRGGILPDLMTSTRGQLGTLGNIYAHISSYDTAFYHEVNSRIEAEHYIRMENVSLVESTDDDGDLSIGYTTTGSQVEYQVNLPESTTYPLALRTAGEQPTRIAASVDGNAVGIIDIPASGGWTSWQQVEQTLPLPAGRHRLQLQFLSGSCDINWMKIRYTQTGIEQPRIGDYHSSESRKYMKNGQLYIEQNGVIYTILGQRMIK